MFSKGKYDAKSDHSRASSTEGNLRKALANINLYIPHILKPLTTKTMQILEKEKRKANNQLLMHRACISIQLYYCLL